MFSTLYSTYFSFQKRLKMSAAICFNLDQSKILLSGNGLRGLSTIFCVEIKNAFLLSLRMPYVCLVLDREFNPFPDMPWFLRVCIVSLLKTLREKEKLLVTSNLSFSHSVFYPFGELSAIFIKLKIVVCNLFEFGII